MFLLLKDSYLFYLMNYDVTQSQETLRSVWPTYFEGDEIKPSDEIHSGGNVLFLKE
jgi:hypothetical protein